MDSDFPTNMHEELDTKPDKDKDKKRRAFKACSHCRARKAKCDLGDLSHPREPPCARCKREGITCTFLPSRRGGRVPFAARGSKGAADEQQEDFSFNKPESSGRSLSPYRQGSIEVTQSSVAGSSYFYENDNGDISIDPGLTTLDRSFDLQTDSPHLPPIISGSMPPTSRTPHSARPSDYPYPMNPAGNPSPRQQTAPLPWHNEESETTGRAAMDAMLFNPPTPAQPQMPTHQQQLQQQQQAHLQQHHSSHQKTKSAATQSGRSMLSQPVAAHTYISAPEASTSSISRPLQTQISAAPGSGVSPSGESHSSYDSLNRPKQRRHADDNRIADPDALAAAKLNNPIDALNLLVLAADAREGKTDGGRKMGTSPENALTNASGEQSYSREEHERGHGNEGRNKKSSPTPPPFVLADFLLVKRGIVTTMELIYFVNLFFRKIHHLLPMVPFHRIPATEAALTAFARDELHLTTVFVLIASRLDQGGNRQMEIHDKCWVVMQELIANLILGKSASVGAVEALLLLSENPPRNFNGDDYADENRMSWMIVGNAVRIGYMLALDQTSLYPTLPKVPDTPEGKAAIEKLDRERIAWTYCYLFDRQISIRTGKAFWSRGPGLCFTGSSADSFPSMRAIPGVQDDYASLIQAYVEITQTMTSAHDILYPSRDRTNTLVRGGAYYKYIDEFTRTLNAFRYTWENKKWETFPLTDCVWVHFHYLRLYIYAFAFQAHVTRATTEAGEDNGNAVSDRTMFPRGPMGSPDAKFILEAIDAAADLLRICTDRLHPQGVLQFLPWRYFLFFAYASVFLLKAVFINAVAPMDRRTIVRLLKRVIVCLACSSKDDQHHAVKYARLLNSLLRTFSRGADGVGTGAPTPRRSPAGSPVPQQHGDWPVSRAASPSAGQFRESTSHNGHMPVAHATPAPTGLAAFSTTMQGYSNAFAQDTSSLPNNSAFMSDTFHPNTAQEEATAADLLADFNLDFDFPQGEPTAPIEAYGNLLDDTTMNFWAALGGSSTGDWPNVAFNGI